MLVWMWSMWTSPTLLDQPSKLETIISTQIHSHNFVAGANTKIVHTIESCHRFQHAFHNYVLSFQQWLPIMFKYILLLSSWIMLQLVHYSIAYVSNWSPSSKYWEACPSSRIVKLSTSRGVIVLQSLLIFLPQSRNINWSLPINIVNFKFSLVWGGSGGILHQSMFLPKTKHHFPHGYLRWQSIGATMIIVGYGVILWVWWFSMGSSCVFWTG